MFAALALACGGPRTSGAPPAAPPAAVAEFAAIRWIPARPTYALAGRSVRDAQRTLADVVDSIGMIVDVDSSQVSAALRVLLAVDPLAPDALTAMGIDLEGGIAVFSESIHPTFVVHLAAPEQTAAFFDQERSRGLATQSQIIDGAELFTAKLRGNASVSWVIEQDWLWVHFTLSFGPDEGTGWFTASRKPTAPTWAADFEWAKTAGNPAARPRVVGFVDPRALLSRIAARVPDALACARLVEPVGRVGLAFDGDGRTFGTRIALDLGASASVISQAVLPAPGGWDDVASRAPLAVQWNLDLEAVRGWLAPCARVIAFDVSTIDTFGVRAARVILQSFDPGEQEGTGVVALDVTSKQYFASLLDDIPLRSTLESSRKYGPHAGRRLSIPFGPTVDYVLTDRLVLAGVGEGLLARAVGGQPRSSPVFALDLAPAGLTREAWEFLLRTARIPFARRVAERLQYWRDAHLSIEVDQTRLVFEASGTRR